MRRNRERLGDGEPRPSIRGDQILLLSWNVRYQSLSKGRLDLIAREIGSVEPVDAGDVKLGDAVPAVGDRMSRGPYLDYNRFLEMAEAEMRWPRATMTAKRKKLLLDSLAERDEAAVPVVKKVHRRATVADTIQGLYEVSDGAQKWVVEYEPDSELRDTEQIPLQKERGIVGFLRREVLPYAEDAWYVAKSVKIGYEISFNRYFYKPEPMRTREETRAAITAVERETEGLPKEILGAGMTV